MGIPGFNTWFYDNNEKAYQPMAQTTVDHLYIDMNSVLHNVLRKADNYDKYHALLHKRLDAILRLTNPRKSVMLAIDGPAPLAKLMTQRERRKKSFTVEARKKEQQAASSGAAKAARKRKGNVVSSTALTPGTPFMHDVCVSCSYFICARLANRKWQHLEWELSGPTVAGEGEVKILGRLARPRHEAAVGPDDTHMIVGDDADLILMALVSSTPRLFILNAALSDNTLSPQTAVLSVDKLHSVWLAAGIAGPDAAAAAAAAAGDSHAQQQQELPREVLLRLLGAKADLALLAILSSGNDYLPAVRGGLRLLELWDSYVKLRQLPDFAGSSIITMTSHSPAVQEQQHQDAADSNNGGGSSSSSSTHMRELAVTAELDTLMLAEVLAVAMEGNKHLAKLAERGSSISGGGRSTVAAVAGAVSGAGNAATAAAAAGARLNREAAEALPWLKGLLWTMSMYFAGDCPDYRWCYSGSTPTASGLRALAAAATAAMQDSSSGGSGINGAAGQKPSEHHKLRLSSFSLSCCTGGSSSSGGGGSPGAAAEWQAAIAAAAARLGGSSSVSFDPLLPHVCSLALLPAGAQEHVPSAVQHLMDSGSPIYDMYASCEGCEEVQQEAYLAQRAYDAVLEQVKALEAQVQALQVGAGEQQQQQAERLAARQSELAAAKAAALAVLHAAVEKRRRHEAEEHPEGLHSFDLGRLEAAVSSVPASEFEGEQRALTQLSHSLLFRMGTPPSQRQQPPYRQYGQQQDRQYGQQQQYHAPFSSGSSHLPGRMYQPPPPPVERFGPAFYNYGGNRGYSSGAGPVVLRSLLWETAFGCQVREDPDLRVYSSYMVVGTDAAAPSSPTAAGADPAEGGAQHKRKHPQQQQQQQVGPAFTNSGAAAAIKAALQGGPGAAAQLSSKATKSGSADGAAAAASDAAAALAAHQLNQQSGKQQQQKRAAAGGGGMKHPRKRSPSPRSRGPSDGPHATVATQQPPAPQQLPLPGTLLGRSAGGSGGAAPPHTVAGYAAATGGSGYRQPVYYAGAGGRETQQQQQQRPQVHSGSYNPLQHQHESEQQRVGYYQQPWQQQQQGQQHGYPTWQQQQHGGYAAWQQRPHGAYQPLQQQQQYQYQFQEPHPLRSVSPGGYNNGNSSSYGVVPRPPVMPPGPAAAARPPHPGMHFP